VLFRCLAEALFDNGVAVGNTIVAFFFRTGLEDSSSTEEDDGEIVIATSVAVGEELCYV
jgi:hypothetical protein